MELGEITRIHANSFFVPVYVLAEIPWNWEKSLTFMQIRFSYLSTYSGEIPWNWGVSGRGTCRSGLVNM